MTIKPHRIKEVKKNTQYRGKFFVKPIYSHYSDYVNVEWGGNEFETLEEAEEFVTKELKQNLERYAIVQIYGRYWSENKLIVDKDTPKRQWAVFSKTYRKIVYCGVVEAYDRTDALSQIRRYWANKSQARLMLLDDKGKINKRRYNQLIRDLPIEIELDKEEQFKFEFPKIKTPLERLI